MCDTEIFYSHDNKCWKEPEQKPLVLRRNTLNKRITYSSVEFISIC